MLRTMSNRLQRRLRKLRRKLKRINKSLSHKNRTFPAHQSLTKLDQSLQRSTTLLTLTQQIQLEPLLVEVSKILQETFKVLQMRRIMPLMLIVIRLIHSLEWTLGLLLKLLSLFQDKILSKCQSLRQFKQLISMEMQSHRLKIRNFNKLFKSNCSNSRRFKN